MTPASDRPSRDIDEDAQSGAPRPDQRPAGPDATTDATGTDRTDLRRDDPTLPGPTAESSDHSKAKKKKKKKKAAPDAVAPAAGIAEWPGASATLDTPTQDADPPLLARTGPRTDDAGAPVPPPPPPLPVQPGHAEPSPPQGKPGKPGGNMPDTRAAAMLTDLSGQVGPADPATPRKSKRNDQPDTEEVKPLGTSKAVETMFRNAVRAELDIIALAATKANIMISLNGFIISALMISGAFLFNTSPGFLIPAAVFLVTSAASIVFALLAASPERADLAASIRDWLRDVSARTARLRDLRRYVMQGRDAARGDDLNLLIYEDRVRMTREEHWDRMQALLRDRDDIYRKMTDQLYWLGQMANHKFKLLNVSYTVFRWGLLASVLVFLGTRGLFGLFPGLTGERVLRLQNLGISEFRDIYEPSAVQQLPDGRILVVEDEAKRAVSVMTLAEDGSLVEDSAADLRLTRAFGRKLSDLEGLTIDRAENIYAVTSHSVTGKGERSRDREQLLRFRISGMNVGNVASVTNLRDALVADNALAEALRSGAGEPVDLGKLNIEGLAFHQQTGQLLLGLRAPRAGGRSIIVPILNPAAMFDAAADADFGDPILLDLQGGGIRALSFDPVLGAFLIVNEIEGDDDNKMSQLWTWNGDPAVQPAPIALPEIINLNNVESIDSIMVQGEPRLLIMSDEGDPKKDRPAKYMMLDYGQLSQ